MVKTDTMPEGAIFHIGKNAEGQWFTATVGDQDGVAFLKALHSLLCAMREAFIENQPDENIEAIRKICDQVQRTAYYQYVPVAELAVLHLAICRAVEMQAMIEILSGKRHMREADEAHVEPGGEIG